MFKSRLIDLRKKTKLRQEDLAKKVDIARTTYAMYEQGKRQPDYETLQKIADFHDVTIDYLLGRSNDPRLSKKEDEEANERARELLEILESMEDEEERKSLEEQVLSYAKFLREADKNKK